MTNRHKWADVIIAYVNGQVVQYYSKHRRVWSDCTVNNDGMPDFDYEREWRIKPKTIMIGDMEVPEPMRVAPKDGTKYYVVSLFVGPTVKLWGEYDYQEDWLSKGLLHLDRDAAIAHAKALIKVSGGTV